MSRLEYITVGAEGLGGCVYRGRKGVDVFLAKWFGIHVTNIIESCDSLHLR
jgi:hypothetical protein